jgi:AbrB family looped-hinge helix DNA binding protein
VSPISTLECHIKQRTTKIDRHGRIVIPAEYRRALGMREGDEVTVQLDGGAVRILTRSEAIRRAQELVTRRVGKKRSLVEELAADRRAEAARE